MSTEIEKTGVKRRDFLKVVGAGAASATAIGCSSEKVEKLIPYLVSPDETVPGVSTYYATTCRECSAGCGLIAETRDGRTIKLEGNPAHPVNRGALCARGQAALQGLYNPDRYRGPMVRSGGSLKQISWDEALTVFSQKVAASRGAGAVFINQHESGSFPAFLDGWLAANGMAPHISYDGDSDTAAIAANRQAYGVAWPRLDFSSARLIVSFGADFLDSWGPSVPQQLDFADARAKLDGAPRFIYIGPRRSLTGLNADVWIPCNPGSEIAIARMLGGSMTAAQAAQASGANLAALTALAREFAAAKPSMLVAGGSGSRGQELAFAVNALNQSSGNVGSTIRPAEALLGYELQASTAEIASLIARMNSGGVSLLMVRGANPANALPQTAGFAAAMAKVPYKVSFSTVPDETTSAADLILPDHHFLEQWGDAEPVRGTLSLQQPAMDPVFDTRATADVLIAVSNKASAGAYPTDYRSWLTARFAGGAAGLSRALGTGVVAGSIAPSAGGARAVPQVPSAAAIDQTRGDYYLMVYPHPVLGSRGANKPWLQELPDPVTKTCWQTVAEVHPQTAKKLGVENGDLLKLETDAGSITIPALIYLGIQPGTVAVAAGRGRKNSGRYASAGANAYDILPATFDASGGLALVSTKVRVSKAAGHQQIVTTEGSARQHGRGIGKAIYAADLREGGGDHGAPAAADSAAAAHGASKAPPGEENSAGHHKFIGDASKEFLPGLRSPTANDAQGDLGTKGTESKDKGMYDPNHWSGMAKRRWAMTVDLARCTGCSACVTACYSENNIPTVGAEWQGAKVFPDRTGFGANILRSREMAWLRIERYFEGGEDGGADFDTRFVPMLCQHCGNAPCEPVCPVYATYHAPDGLNVQVYNRCVGTRYCSNNCPYKVRYFNWFGYGEPNRSQYAFPEPLNWQLNPDVTVRGKGVMEKCTFCVQRIREAENRAKGEGRELIPDEFSTACAEACPSRAITFGDAADDRWKVAQLAKDKRAYHVFEELNTFTAVVYLKKVLHNVPATSLSPAAGGDSAAVAPGVAH